MTLALTAAARRVRTPEGAAKYGQPIGTIITKDIIEAAKRAAKAVVPSGGEAPRVPGAEERRAGTSPRDSIRQRVRNWFTAPDMSPDAQKVVDGFDPRTFESDQQAGQYALNRAKPGRFERSPIWSGESHEAIANDSITGFHEAQAAIRKGDTDNPQAKAFTARFQRNSTETPDDLLVSRRVAPDAFPGGVEGLAGKEVHDAAYFQGNLGTPIGDAPVLLTVAVPAGTRAMFTGNGPNDRGVILDRDQRLRITKVTPDGKGGWYVAAVAVPKTGATAGELKEGTDAPGTKAARGGPGAPPLLERETGRRAPGFAQPRGFDEPLTRAAPPTGSGRPRTPTEIAEEEPAIRQTKQLPADTVAELNDPKTTISRYRDIAREADIKAPARIIKKADIRDFLLGKKGAPPARARGLRVETPEVETRKLSPEAVGQLNEPKTTVAQLRKIAKDHGIKVPSTATRKADIRAHLMQAGGVKENPPDMLPEGERNRFRAGWREVSKAPEGLAQAELNEIFLDVHGGRLGVIDAARRLENSAGIDREERDRLRARRGDGEPGAEERKLDDEIAAKEKAAKFLRDYRLTEEEKPAPAKKAVKKAAPRKAAAKKAAPAAPKKATSSSGAPRAAPRLNRDELERFNEGQLRVMARNGGVEVPEGATRAEIIDALASKPAPASFNERIGRARQGASVTDLPQVQIQVDASSGSDTGRWKATNVTGFEGAPGALLTAATSRVRRSGFANSRLRVPGGRPLEDWEVKLRAGYDPDTRARLEAQDSAKAAKNAATADREIRAIDKAMAQSRLPSDVIVWRGARSGDIGLPSGDAAAGFEWTDPGYVGTSASRSVAEYDFAGQGQGTLLRILAPGGTSAISIEGGGEHEVLLDRGLRFRVIADRGRPGGPEGPRLLDVEIMPASTDDTPAQPAKTSAPRTVRQIAGEHGILDDWATMPASQARSDANASLRTSEDPHRIAERLREEADSLESEESPDMTRGISRSEDDIREARDTDVRNLRRLADAIEQEGAPSSIEEDPFPTLTEDQLRNIAQARGIHVPASATKAEIARLISRGGGEMTGSGAVATPHSTVQVRPALAQATGPRTLARATQAKYKRITGRDLAIDFGTDPDLSIPTAREHMEGVLRAAEQWPDVDLREVRWFNGELSEPGKQRPWAISANGAIMFSTAYTSKANRERYLGELADGVAGWDNGGTGFHPRGAATPAAVAMHEFGHLIAPERAARNYPGVLRLVQRRAKEDRVPPSRLIRREVSRYADTNPSELVAEAVLDVLINGDAAGQLARQIVELLRTGRL